jgi:creatinine amidohydrolase/Fe(II)-dependent formamide hydrolase-like protein
MGRVPAGQRWEDLAAPAFAGLRASGDEWAVLLPLGAIEQHGRHLPVDVDAHLATAVCAAVAERDPHVLVAPAIPWGISGSHVSFGGAITLRPETLLSLLRDVCESVLASGIRCILIVNGHNGNMYVAGQAAAELGTREGTFVGALNYFDLVVPEFRATRRSRIGGEGHAGELETSLQLHLRPGMVGGERDVRYVDAASHAAFADLAERGAIVHGFDLARDYPEGVMGDPQSASAELGERLLGVAVEELLKALDELRAHLRRPHATQ